MSSDFDQQSGTPVRANRTVLPAPAAKRKWPPHVPDAISAKTISDRILEHETEAAFLKELIAIDDNEATRQLRDGLAKAARESKCIRRAIVLMLTIFCLSVAGLGYCALLLPQIFFNPTHLVTRSLSFLGLVALISELEFLACLLWHRLTVNRLHKECRRQVLVLAESRLRDFMRRSPGADPAQEPVA